MMVITLKHAGAVLMQILILLLKQFFCAPIGNRTLISEINFTLTLYTLYEISQVTVTMALLIVWFTLLRKN
jgi:hypothetical protein